MGAVAAQAQHKVGPPPHTKRPKVFLDYDQVELDAMYNQAVYAPNAVEVQQRYASNSELTRARLGAPLRVAYGPSEIEKLDIFRCQGGNAPVQVFIHGGAWRGGTAKDYCFPAEMFVVAGAHFVVPDFANVQDVGGSLLSMERQVRRALQWVHDHADTFGGDARRIFVTGHSSGAHLAGAMLTLIPEGTVCGAMLVSGMYDLRAPRLSSRSSYVKFDDATEDTLSPQRHIDKINLPLVVAYGTMETPEFQRQSREFAAAVKGGREVCRHDCGRELQPLRVARDAGKSLRDSGSRGFTDDEPGSRQSELAAEPLSDQGPYCAWMTRHPETGLRLALRPADTPRQVGPRARKLVRLDVVQTSR